MKSVLNSREKYKKPEPQSTKKKAFHFLNLQIDLMV